jgi:hypothetical protein
VAGPPALPLSNKDRDAGYWWQTSMRQIEISRTLVFCTPPCPWFLRSPGAPVSSVDRCRRAASNSAICATSTDQESVGSPYCIQLHAGTSAAIAQPQHDPDGRAGAEEGRGTQRNRQSGQGPARAVPPLPTTDHVRYIGWVAQASRKHFMSSSAAGGADEGEEPLDVVAATRRPEQREDTDGARWIVSNATIATTAAIETQ